MRFFDITRAIRSGMDVYPGDPPVEIERVLSIAGGAPANVSRICLGSHTGTHVDAPLHFRDGSPGAGEIPLDILVGPVRLCELSRGPIDGSALEELDLDACARLLFKFDASTPERERGLNAAAATLLVQAGILLVGVEADSVDPLSSTDFPAHRILLDAGVILVEGLDLSGVPAGRYELLCLPLKIEGSDGSPARVVLRGPA